MENLPKGVSWEPSPLFDWSKSPRFSMAPDMLRLVSVAHMAMHYGQADVENTVFRVLDVPCGFGEIYTLLKVNRFAKGVQMTYVGIDVDPRKEKRAREIQPTIDYRLCDVTKNLLEVSGPEQYDIIVSTEGLEHLHKPDGEKFLENLWSMLAYGGYFILTCPTPEIRRENPWHLYQWSFEELDGFIKDHGWPIIDFFWMKGSSKEIKKALDMASNRMPNEILRGAFVGTTETGSVMVYVLRKLLV